MLAMGPGTSLSQPLECHKCPVYSQDSLQPLSAMQRRSRPQDSFCALLLTEQDVLPPAWIRRYEGRIVQQLIKNAGGSGDYKEVPMPALDIWAALLEVRPSALP